MFFYRNESESSTNPKKDYIIIELRKYSKHWQVYEITTCTQINGTWLKVKVYTDLVRAENEMRLLGPDDVKLLSWKKTQSEAILDIQG